MRISHIELESCRSNPRRWYLSSLTSSSHPYKMGYDRLLRYALAHFHNTSAADARRYLANGIAKHDFRNAKRVTEIENSLESYIDWAASVRLRIADVNARLEFLEGYLELRGEISRVDVTTAGYRAVLLTDPPNEWKTHLRMPLIQSAISSIYGRPATEIQVGFQNLDGTDLAVVSYGTRRLEEARAEFRTLGRRIRRLSKP